MKKMTVGRMRIFMRDNAAVSQGEADGSAAKNAVETAALEEAARLKAAEDAIVQKAHANAEATTSSIAAGSRAIAGTAKAELKDVATEVEHVMVDVPKQFVMRVADHTTRIIKAGVQKMEASLASHWWSKANGVKVVNPAPAAGAEGAAPASK